MISYKETARKAFMEVLKNEKLKAKNLKLQLIIKNLRFLFLLLSCSF
jgi:hypothetical protein